MFHAEINDSSINWNAISKKCFRLEYLRFISDLVQWPSG